MPRRRRMHCSPAMAIRDARSPGPVQARSSCAAKSHRICAISPRAAPAPTRSPSAGLRTTSTCACILPLVIKEKSQLYNTYMPFLRGGGLFVPTAKRYSIGDDVFLLLTLLDDPERLGIACKVVWLTPPGAQGNRVAGVGVQFADSAE